ncbi:MAG TPA: plastocyanin/azurin family copper-binding protein [Actinomycetota bacterium]|nr:plastocyanin/azurin family copper-binding protein [Actinomycetota bacterium]
MRRLLATTLVALAAAACAPAAASPSSTTLRVGIHYSAFSTGAIDVEPGQTVRFVVTNRDPIDHEFIIGDRVVQFAHERGTEAFHPPRPGEITIPAGETVTTTFTFGERDLLFGCHLPGHYAYGMRGTMEVV